MTGNAIIIPSQGWDTAAFETVARKLTSKVYSSIAKGPRKSLSHRWRQRQARAGRYRQ
jgi:hypothetical protein